MLRKICSRCSEPKPLGDFNRNRSKSDGRQSFCRPCVGEHGAGYRRNNREVLAASEANYRTSHKEERASLAVAYRRRNPDQIKARKAVSHAIATGLLVVRPCGDCGLEPLKADGRQRIQAHHHKGYAVEFHLDVAFLCVPCHIARDKEEIRMQDRLEMTTVDATVFVEIDGESTTITTQAPDSEGYARSATATLSPDDRQQLAFFLAAPQPKKVWMAAELSEAVGEIAETERRHHIAELYPCGQECSVCAMEATRRADETKNA